MAPVVRFEWDENKNQTNQRKHGIGFQEAAQIFLDPMHSSVLDRVDDGEQRWQTIGLTSRHLLVLVAYTTSEYDDDGQAVEIVRFISARRADRKERQRYEEGSH